MQPLLEPSEDNVREVAQALSDGVANTTPAAQARLVAWLAASRTSPLFCCCLCAVALREDLPAHLRQLAVLELKQCAAAQQGGCSAALTRLRATLTRALASVDAPVAAAASAAVTAVVRTSGLCAWPGLLDELWALAAAPPSPHARPQALVCLQAVCEDCAVQLDTPPDEATPAPAEVLLPSMLSMLARKTTDTRCTKLLLGCVSRLLASESLTDPLSAIGGVVVDNMADVLAVLGAVEPAARGEVLDVYKGLLAFHHEVAAVPGATLAMLRFAFDEASATPASAVSSSEAEEEGERVLRACRFWAEVSSVRPVVNQMAASPPMLSQLLALLLGRLACSDADAEAEEGGGGDDGPPPQQRQQHQQRCFGRGGGGEEEHVRQGTARTAAAAALENLAATLGGDVVAPAGCAEGWLLEKLGTMLRSADWRQVEAGVHAVGAVSRGGAFAAVEPSLPSLLPMLLAMLDPPSGPPSPGRGGAPMLPSQHQLVRATACDTLVCFETYIVSQGGDALRRGYVSGLLRCMLDPSPAVQGHAVAAFASLMANHAQDIACGPQLADIVERLGGLLRYSAPPARLLRLLDCVRLLAEGSAGVDTPQCHARLFAPLCLSMLPSTPADSPLLPGVLRTCRACAVGLGPSFAPYLPPVCGMLHAIAAAYHTDHDSTDGELAAFALAFASTLLREVGEAARPPLFFPLEAGGASFVELALLPLTRPHKVCDRVPFSFHPPPLPPRHTHPPPPPTQDMSRRVVENCLYFLEECANAYAQEAAPHILSHAASIVRYTLHADDGCTEAACNLLREVCELAHIHTHPPTPTPPHRLSTQ